MDKKGTTSKLEIILVFAFFLLAYGFFYQYPSWNGNSRLALVKALVEERRFEIDSYHDNKFDTGDKAYFNGHYYSDKPIGTALIGAVFYYPVYRISLYLEAPLNSVVFSKLMTFFIISFPSAFLGPLLYVYTKRIRNSPGWAWAVALAIGLGTMYFAYSSIYMSHTLVGMLLFAAFFIWHSIRHGYLKPTIWMAFLSGALLGSAFISEYPSAIAIAIIIIYAAHTLWKQGKLANWKIISAFALTAFIPLVLQGYHNYAVFGNIFSIGSQYHYVDIYQNAMNHALAGIGLPKLKNFLFLTVHPTMGIFWQSPVLVAAFIGWAKLYKHSEFRSDFWLSALIILGTITLFSGFPFWWGGAAFGPRYIILCLPFFGIPLAFLPDKWFKPFIILIILSTAQMLIPILTRIDHGSYNDNLTLIEQTKLFEYTTIYNGALPLLKQGYLSQNHGQDMLKLMGAWSLIPLGIGLSIIGLLARRQSKITQ